MNLSCKSGLVWRNGHSANERKLVNSISKLNLLYECKSLGSFLGPSKREGFPDGLGKPTNRFIQTMFGYPANKALSVAASSKSPGELQPACFFPAPAPDKNHLFPPYPFFFFFPSPKINKCGGKHSECRFENKGGNAFPQQTCSASR